MVTLRGNQLRQPEIENLGQAARRHEDVGRLDVAMKNSVRMRRFQRVGELNPQLEQPAIIERTSFNQGLEGFPLPSSIAMNCVPSCSWMP